MSIEGADRSMVSFVWQHSKLDQIVLLALTIGSFPLVYLSLEVPKIIINEAIGGADFPRDILGFEMRQVPFLLTLCLCFLGLVVTINGFKWLINVGIGMSGERLLRRLRFTLVDRVMRVPMARYRSVRPGETIQSIMGEIEMLGGFFGEVVVTPVFQGGLLLVYITFIFVQDVWLGLAAIAFYPIQTFLIPLLQARVVRLNRERAGNARRVADAIGDTINLSTEIRSNGTLRWHLAHVSGLLYTNTRLRQAIYRRKFTIKWINNFINQLPPFLFYSIGGLAVLRGDIEIGALVAVLAAYKDVAAPWKALLTYWQRLSDFSSRFRFVMENFGTEGQLGAEKIAAGPFAPIEGNLCVVGVPPEPEIERPGVDSFTLVPGQTVALAGGTPEANTSLLRLLAGLEPPATGRVSVGETALRDVPLGQLGTTIALVQERPGLVPGSIRQNLVYSLFRNEPRPGAGEDAERRLREARRTGNTLADVEGDWIDYDAAGVSYPEELDLRLLALSQRFGLDRSLYALALDMKLPASRAEAWREPLARAREALGDAPTLGDLIEPWRRDSFNTNGSLLANLLFALPQDPLPRPSDFLGLPDVQALLKEAGGDRLMAEIGWEIAVALNIIAQAAGESTSVLDQLGGFARRDVTDAAAIVGTNDKRSPHRLRRSERARLMALAANFVEVRDQLDVLDDGIKQRALEVRRKALARVEKNDGFVPLDSTRYNPARTVGDYLLHARRRFDRRSAWTRIDRHIAEVIRGLGLEAEFVRLGMEAPIREAKLPWAALKRLGLVRAVLKQPRFLLLPSMPDAHEDGEEGLIRALRKELPQVGLAFTTAATESCAADEIATIGIDGKLGPAVRRRVA
ncbi:MAG: ABC transporter transmembrane domain-containing protein [Pseudomonadota bacterium]